MFTGIVEEIGKISHIKNGIRSKVLQISANKILEDINLGDSIAVNGVCLTVTGYDNKSFSVDVMNETLQRSSLSNVKNGIKVNLERAMSANGRFGGHIVSGHIDSTGKISNITKDDNAIIYEIKCGKDITKYIIEKGSIAIDGISLTVIYVSNDKFAVSIIPHTATNTILSDKRVGDIVNLENDCIGKYVEKILLERQIENKVERKNKNYKNDSKNNNAEKIQNSYKSSGITEEFLLKNGF